MVPAHLQQDRHKTGSEREMQHKGPASMRANISCWQCCGSSASATALCGGCSCCCCGPKPQRSPAAAFPAQRSLQQAYSTQPFSKPHCRFCSLTTTTPALCTHQAAVERVIFVCTGVAKPAPRCLGQPVMGEVAQQPGDVDSVGQRRSHHRQCLVHCGLQITVLLDEQGLLARVAKQCSSAAGPCIPAVLVVHGRLAFQAAAARWHLNVARPGVGGAPASLAIVRV